MKIALFANTDWFMYNFNRSLADHLLLQGHEVILLSPSGSYGSMLSELGYSWHPVPMNRNGLNPYSEIRLIYWIKSFLQDNKVDLVHSFTIKCCILGSLAAKLTPNCLSVNSLTGLGHLFTGNTVIAKALRPFVTLLMKFSFSGIRTRLVVLNKDDYGYFISKNFVKPERLFLVPGAGVNSKMFSPNRRIRSSESFRVLFPARLLWDKGVREFIDAARELRTGNRKIDFFMAGAPDSGNPSSVPKNLLETWAYDGVVTLLGHVDDMPNLYNSMDVVVLPSYREGLPTSLTEAGACELALIATDVPGCRDVINDGLDGFLVEPRNAKSLARAIEKLHDDRSLVEKFGRAARIKVLSNFDENVVNRITSDIYSDLTSISK